MQHIQRNISRRLNPRHKMTTKEERNSVALLCYIERITDKIGKVLHKHIAKPVFKSLSKITHLLSPKDSFNPFASKVVYDIPCSY